MKNIIIRIFVAILSLFVILSFAACNGTNDQNSTDESGDSVTESGTGDSSSNNGGSQGGDKESKYSKLLQDVLKSEEYNELIKYAHNTNPHILKTGEFDPHPYAFLESKGFDVAAIKKGKDLCHTISYTVQGEPNSLYIYTRVDCGDYYEIFLLKYELTDKEMHDYSLTHTGGGNVNVRFYIQAVFMNREIAKTREPEIVGTSKMSKESFEMLTESMNGRYGTGACNIIIINPKPEEYTFELILLPQNTNKYGATCTSKIVDLNCKGTIRINNGVFTGPTSYGEFRAKSSSHSDSTLYYIQEQSITSVMNSNLNYIDN